MKRYKSCLNRKLNRVDNCLEPDISSIIDIRSVSLISHTEALKPSRGQHSIVEQKPSPPQCKFLVTYLKSLENANKRLQSEILAYKESNSVISKQNKDLAQEKSLYLSILSRLQGDISKLGRNLHSLAAGDLQSSQIYKTVCQPKQKSLLRSSSNALAERKKSLIDTIVLERFSSKYARSRPKRLDK